MSPAHRRYLVLQQSVGAAAVNFVLNAGLAALMFRRQDAVPLWGQQSIVGDTIGTTFMLPLLTCLIVTPLARGQMRAGRVTPLGWTHTSHPFLTWLPISTTRRGLILAFLCVALIGPPSVWALSALGIDTLSFWRFVLFKAGFAAGLAAVVTPVIAVWAIAGAEPAPVPPAPVPLAPLP
jgi:hypothetical protein